VRTIEEIAQLKVQLEGEGTTRHADYDRLVEATHGSYHDRVITDTWKKWEGIVYETGFENENGDRNKVRVTVNLLNPIIEAKRSLWSIIPSIRCPYKDLDPVSVANADKLETTLRWLWRESRIGEVLGDAGWYGALLGTSVLCVWPDFITKRPKIICRSPYGFYAVPNNLERDGTSFNCVFFVTKVLGRQVKAMYPDVKDAEGIADSAMVDVVEYWDTEQKFTYLEQGNVMLSEPIANKLGFVPVVTVPNISQPGMWWGKSDVIDAIPIVSELNKRFNMENQAISDMAGAPWEAINPAVDATQLSLDPDAINPFDAGGGLKKSSTNNLPYQIFQSDAVLRQYVDMVTDLPEVMRSMFGGNVATGKGIQALMGPIQARMELRQRYLYPRLQLLNKMAMMMWAKYWRGQPQLILGSEKGKSFNLEVKIEEFEGFYENEVYLDSSSYFDVQSRAIVGLQMVQNELLSAKTFIQKMNPFVENGEQEIEQIRVERQERIETAMASQMMMQSPGAQFPQMGGPPGQMASLEAGMQGAPRNPVPPPPGINEGAFENQMFDAGLLPTNKTSFTEEQGSGTGPWGEFAGELPGQMGGGLLEQLADAIRSISKIRGRVFLTGSILEGEIGPEGIEIWFTEMLDWATVRQAVVQMVPEAKGKFSEPLTCEEEPSVTYLEVTPGTSGYEPTEPMGGGFDMEGFMAGLGGMGGGPEMGGMPPEMGMDEELMQLG
jgi:hypothetical protein